MGVCKRGIFSVEDPLFWVFWPKLSILLKQITKQQADWIVLINSFVYFRRLKCSTTISMNCATAQTYYEEVYSLPGGIVN